MTRPATRLIKGLFSLTGHSLHEGLEYGSHGRHRLDIYRPRAATGKAPVIVFFHGGSWQTGSRVLYPFVGHALAGRGYVTVIPDYRLYPDAQFPDFVEDGAEALAWTRRHIADHGGDPGAIAVMGHSAGAHLGALLVTDPAYLDHHGLSRSSLAAFVGLAGPYSFNPLKTESVRPVFAATPDIARARPFLMVRGGEPPMLLLHGRDDETVTLQNTEELARRVHEQGGFAEVVFYEGLGHIAIVTALARGLRWQAPMLEDIDRFLKGHLS